MDYRAIAGSGAGAGAAILTSWSRAKIKRLHNTAGGNMDMNMGIDTDSGHGYKHGFQDMDTDMGMDIDMDTNIDTNIQCCGAAWSPHFLGRRQSRFFLVGARSWSRIF